MPEIEIRPLATQKEYDACVALQRRTWGDSFTDVVPPSILQIAQRMGGVAVGAFDRKTLVGFVFGITGVEDGMVVHWSDMLAVAPKVRNHGVGRRLKEYQRTYLAKKGVKLIYWTYDPLVARNAHLNFNVFGVRVVEYVENMYGESHSPLHQGIGTDRFIVAWPVADRELAVRREEIARATREAGSRKSGAILRIEIPLRIDQIQKNDMRTAKELRRLTRKALTGAMQRGYRVNGFVADDTAKRGYYILTR